MNNKTCYNKHLCGDYMQFDKLINEKELLQAGYNKRYITMLYAVYKYLNTKDKDTLKDYVAKIIISQKKIYHLDDTLKDLSFYKTVEEFGTYYNNKININLNYFMKYFTNEKPLLLEDYQELAEFITACVFHELTHAWQFKNYVKYPSDAISFIISLDNILQENFPHKYVDYHDYFPTEHQANYLGTINTMRYFSKSLDCPLYMQNCGLFDDYEIDDQGKIISPFGKLLVITKNNPRIVNETIKYIEPLTRVSMGLPINKKDYELVKKLTLKKYAIDDK
jgi:hypothetical protein